MAAQLSDVDVIIGGDSHSLLGDFSTLGLSSAGPYPTVVKNKEGDLVCIGQAWEYAKVFALMQVHFNRRGAVESCAGQASLVLGSAFQRQGSDKAWRSLNAEQSAELVSALSRQPAVKVVEPDASAQAVLQRYTERMAQEKNKTIGTASEAL